MQRTRNTHPAQVVALDRPPSSWTAGSPSASATGSSSAPTPPGWSGPGTSPPTARCARTDRPFTAREHVQLALVLAAGPDRISLRDLALQVRSAAADAGIALDGATSERRALVTALRLLVEHGVVRELDRSVTGYETDADVDALLEVRNDRMALLPVPALVGAESAEELLDRAAGEGTGRGRAAAAARGGTGAALRRRRPRGLGRAAPPFR